MNINVDKRATITLNREELTQLIEKHLDVLLVDHPELKQYDITNISDVQIPNSEYDTYDFDGIIIKLQYKPF